MSSTTSKTRLNRGKLAVAGMIGVAIALAGFAWWWNWQRTQQSLEFYGGEGAGLVRSAEKVEGLQLSGFYDDESVEQIAVGPHAFEVVGRKDLSQVKGLIHGRTALLDDSSYQWNSAQGDCQPTILYAVRFTRGERQITLAFDFSCSTVWNVNTQQSVTLAPKIAAGWKSFLTRQMDPAAATAYEK